MTKHTLFRIVIGLIFVTAIFIGFLAWQNSRTATVLVNWTTASELDTVGFNVYRGDSADGPFDQVNDELIPASPDPLTGGSYKYVDKKVLPGRIYYYQLEDVDTNGASTRHGPIQVKAEGGGRNEFIVSLTLMVVGVIGIIFRERIAQPDMNEKTIQNGD